jgi:hypothetical protein
MSVTGEEEPRRSSQARDPSRNRISTDIPSHAQPSTPRSAWCLRRYLYNLTFRPHREREGLLKQKGVGLVVGTPIRNLGVKNAFRKNEYSSQRGCVPTIGPLMTNPTRSIKNFRKHLWLIGIVHIILYTCIYSIYLCIHYISGLNLVSTPQVFYTCFYNHAHRPRLEKLLYIQLSRSSNGFFKPLLDPGGGFRSETAITRPFRN